MSWDLSLGSKQVVPDWKAEAARLRRFLDVITEQAATQHDKSLQWRNENMTVEQWNDPESITAEVLNQRLRSEDGRSLFPGGPSRSVVQGYLEDAKDSFVNCAWAVGSDDEWQFTASLDFYTEIDGSDDGGAKPLNEYPVAWLASLVSETAQCVEAAKTRIDTMGIFKAMKRRNVPREKRARVGALTLVPNGIGDARLPESISVRSCASDVYPDGVVLAVDLDAAVNEPTTVVDDLLIIDEILMANPSR